MSLLLVDELYNGVEFNQHFKIHGDVNVSIIRPWIYKHGQLQSGKLVCEVYDGGSFLARAVVNHEDINEGVPADYAHGYIRMDFQSLILRIPETEFEREYRMRFYMEDYTNNPSAFVGIIRQWELKNKPTYGDSVNSFIEPAGFELFTYKHI